MLAISFANILMNDGVALNMLQTLSTKTEDNMIISQCMGGSKKPPGWITSYPPVVNGYVMQALNTKL